MLSTSSSQNDASTTFPSRAQVVIVGGGVVGCSVAYHLTKRGWTDVVLVERKELTSGTTWHAAGLVTLARPTHGTRELVKHSLEVFTSLEEETGLGTGFRRTGTMHLATNADRWEELRRQYSAALGSQLEVEIIDADRALELFPLLDPSGIVGGLHYPMDGRGNATDTTMSLAKGARLGGARIFENTTVSKVERRGDRIVGLDTERGFIEAEFVVNCTGMWGREFGAMADVKLPLQAMAHYYIVTDEIPGMPRDMPTIKSSDEWSYVKDDAGNLLVGFFEPGSYPWASRGIPADAEFTTLPEDWEHLGSFYEQMTRRIPVLKDTGIRLHFCGPESFTPDGFFHFGEVPGVTNYYAACGFNSIGFLT
ncbi:MAG: FAD-binding oxidoreductase, partial [Candidatus Nanopelagicales bacterium]